MSLWKFFWRWIVGYYVYFFAAGVYAVILGYALLISTFSLRLLIDYWFLAIASWTMAPGLWFLLLFMIFGSWPFQLLPVVGALFFVLSSYLRMKWINHHV